MHIHQALLPSIVLMSDEDAAADDDDDDDTVVMCELLRCTLLHNHDRRDGRT